MAAALPMLNEVPNALEPISELLDAVPYNYSAYFSNLGEGCSL